MIYFIRNPSARAVKIGYTERPWTRLGELQVGAADPLEMAALVEGDRAAEAAFHLKFHALHIRGEWFHEQDDLAVFVSEQAAPTRPSVQNPKGSALRTARLKAGMTLEEVALAAGLSHSQLSRIERFGTTSLPTAIRLSGFLGVPIAALAREAA